MKSSGTPQPPDHPTRRSRFPRPASRPYSRPHLASHREKPPARPAIEARRSHRAGVVGASQSPEALSSGVRALIPDRATAYCSPILSAELFPHGPHQYALKGAIMSRQLVAAVRSRQMFAAVLFSVMGLGAITMTLTRDAAANSCCDNNATATCTGSKSCSACKNCKYCKHCKSGGTCGVCAK